MRHGGYWLVPLELVPEGVPDAVPPDISPPLMAPSLGIAPMVVESVADVASPIVPLSMPMPMPMPPVSVEPSMAVLSASLVLAASFPLLQAPSAIAARTGRVQSCRRCRSRADRTYATCR